MTRPHSFPRIAIALAVTLILLLATGRIALIPAHVSLDFNEGWNAFQTLHAMGAAPLYPPPGSLTGNNYPPLSFYVVGWLGCDPIVTGRIVALISLIFVGIEVRIAVDRLTDQRTAATIAALAFLGFAVTLFRDYLAIDDPQWLGHAVMTAGFVLIVPPRTGKAPSTGATIAAALLTVAGGLIKHNIVALPFTVTLWLALHHRRALLVWVATGIIAVAVAALVCHTLYGPDFFADLLATDRRTSIARMAKALPILAAFLPGLILSTRLLSQRHADSRIDLLLIALAVSLPFGILQRAGLGVDRNAHFESLIALAIAMGVAWAHAPKPGAALAWITAPFVVLVPLGLVAEAREIRTRSAEEAGWRTMEQRIRATPGRVACETIALCYRAGKDFEIDFFLYGERMAAGRGDAALRQALADHRFAAIQENAREPERRHKEPANPIWALVEQDFRPVFTDPQDRRLLVPRP